MSRWRPYKSLTKAQKTARNKRQYAKRKRAQGSHTDEDVRIQYIFQQGLCFWCMDEVGDNFHKDHLRPIARGGTNHYTNLVISCPHCNLSRGGKLPKNWKWRKVFAYW